MAHALLARKQKLNEDSTGREGNGSEFTAHRSGSILFMR